MKITVPAQGASPTVTISALFGRAPYLLTYDTQSESWEAVSNKINLEATQGAGIQTAQRAADWQTNVLLAVQVGPKAFRVLAANKIAVYSMPGNVDAQQAVEQYLSGKLLPLTEATNESHVI